MSQKKQEKTQKKEKSQEKDMHKLQGDFAIALRALIDIHIGKLDLDHIVSSLEFAKFNLMCVAREQVISGKVMPELQKLKMPEITKIAGEIAKGILKKD